MFLTRRALLTRLLPSLLAGAAASTSCGATDPPLVMTAGEPGGFYIEFADLLVAALRASGTTARAVKSGGSVDNIRRVASGQAALGLTLLDTAQSAVTGTAPFERVLPLSALGRVYENYMQLVVRAEDPADSVADLAGRPVALGAEGSGAAGFGERLLAAAGVAARAAHQPLRDAVQALESGSTDALLWSGGVPTPALAGLAARRPIRLLPLATHLPALRAAYGPVYGPATVPAGGYAGAPAVPTIGVANLLICADTLPDEAARQIVRTLVTDAPELVPDAALGTQYLDQRSLIGTEPVPLHAGAAAGYRDLHG